MIAKSESLIENAIKGCNDLISFIPEKIETQIKKPRQNIILLIEFISLILLITGIIFYRKYRRNKFI